jgi:hypothetical protein
MLSTLKTIVLFIFIVLGVLAVASVVTSPTFRNAHFASPSWHAESSAWS